MSLGLEPAKILPASCVPFASLATTRSELENGEASTTRRSIANEFLPIRWRCSFERHAMVCTSVSESVARLSHQDRLPQVRVSVLSEYTRRIDQCVIVSADEKAQITWYLEMMLQCRTAESHKMMIGFFTPAVLTQGRQLVEEGEGIYLHAAAKGDSYLQISKHLPPESMAEAFLLGGIVNSEPRNKIAQEEAMACGWGCSDTVLLQDTEATRSKYSKGKSKGRNRLRGIG